MNRGEYLIPGLSRDQFKAAIEGPIRVAGGQLTPRLLQRLLNDLGEEQDQLPCLQHALMRTWRVWQGRADAPALDLEDYAQVGKMSQALSIHADEVFSALATDRQRELAAAMFKALTVEGSEKRGIRRPRRLLTLCGTLGVEPAELTPIIDAFRHPEVSFLMPPSDVPLRDTTVIDLSHESLMRVWSCLRDWVDDEAKSVGIFRRLSESAALWRQGKSGFYRDPELSIARAWVESSRPNAVWAEQYDGNFDDAMAFLQASSDAAQEEVRAQEAARQRELAQARALAETERQRAEEQTRFSGRLKWLLRGVGAVALVALAAMVFALAARREAQKNASLALQAEAKAEASGVMVDKARGNAEKLLSFLLEDFYGELEPTGRLETVGKLAREAVAYFDQLPTEMRSPTTRRNRAIAQLRLGQAVYRSGNREEGGAAITTALAELEKMYQGGDRSEATILGLCAALRADTPIRGFGEIRARHSLARARCAELLRPLVSSAKGSLAARFELATALSDLGWAYLTEEAFAFLAEAREVLAAAGALNGSNLRAMAAYSHVTNRMASKASGYDRDEDAVRWWAEALDLAEKALAVQPGKLEALFVRGIVNAGLLRRQGAKGDRAEAWKRIVVANEAFDLLVRSNPSDRYMWGFRLTAKQSLADMLIQDGKIDEALRVFRTEVETATRDELPGEDRRQSNEMRLDLAYWEAARRNRAAAEAALAEAALVEAASAEARDLTSARTGARDVRADQRRRRSGNAATPGYNWNVQQVSLMLHWHLRDYPKFLDEAKKVASKVAAFRATPDLDAAEKGTAEREFAAAVFNLGRGNIFLGHWAEAETHLRQAVDLKDSIFPEYSPAAPQWLAVALARQGRLTEAAEVLARHQLEDVQAAYTKGDHSLYVRWDLARGHYASALTQPNDAAGREKRAAALRQAIALLDESTEEAKQLSEERELRRLIDEELVLVARK